MRSGGRRRSIAFFTLLGIALVGGALALYVGWVIVSWRQAGLLLLGLLVFPLLITGLVLNTIFLVREIRRNEQHEAFINAVTHELKTPVASMKLYLQTLQNRPVDEAKRQQFYGAMIEDSDRLLDTIEQVLRAGQLGARTGHPSKTPIDLGQMVQDCVKVAKTRHRLPDDALTYKEVPGAGAGRRVLGDEDELRAVVSNLIENAIKYSGGHVQVDVELDQADEQAVNLRVRDHGIGISDVDKKRIFRRFYRIPGAPRVKGTGLGLFIVRTAVKRHKGHVFVESDGIGKGSTFTVHLPTVVAP
ncbi:MAG: HAMP domain-containing sensor histidine kinase [Vicinamibacterales bacterium]